MWQGGRWEEISHLNEVGSDSVKKESGVRSSTFSLRSTKIGSSFSSKQEPKFIYATRASGRYKNLGFSPKSKR